MSNLFVVIRAKLYCLKKEHMKQQIYQLCRQAKCQAHQLCCYLCKQQKHKSHEMVNIKMLINQIQQLNKDLQISLQTCAQFDSTFYQILTFIKENKQQFNDVGNILNSIKSFFSKKRNSITNLLALPSELKIISFLDIQVFQKQFLKFLQKIQGFYQSQNKLQESLYHRSVIQMHNQLKNILQKLVNYKKQNKITDLNVLNLFPLEQEVTKKFKPYFCQQLKASCMKISTTKAQMSTSSQQRILCLQPSLERNNKLKRWRIKIIKLASWIGIGACHINKVNYSQPKHGSYFISSNGYSWSSFQTEHNSKAQSFSFKTGDEIEIQFNPRQKKIKFIKQYDNINFQLEVQSNGDPLHPAVNLTGVGDSVQIIS